MDKNDLTGGVAALKILRGTESVDEELEEIRAEANNSEDSGSMSVWQLLTSPQLRLALFITICVHLSQQLSGIVAIFYYSTTFFQVSFSLDISRTFPGHILDIFWTFSGHILDIFWTYPGHFLDISWTFPGHFLDISWPFPRHFLDISKTIHDIFILFRMLESVVTVPNMPLWVLELSWLL